MKKIKAVIFDWAGTTVDFGCMAPVQAFVEVFRQYGIEPTMEEVREPMGMLKIDHIRTMLKMERIKELWVEKYGKEPGEEQGGKVRFPGPSPKGPEAAGVERFVFCKKKSDLSISFAGNGGIFS